MSGTSKIEWTEQTWNPIVGCSIVSPGCTNCYAMKQAARCEAMGLSRYDGLTRKVNGNAVWTGKLAQAPEETLLAPLRRKKPTTYFVNSMGDLFHEDCPDEWIDKVFAVMALTPQHIFQILTKRAARMRDYMRHPATFDRIVVAYTNLERQKPQSIGTPSVTLRAMLAERWPLHGVWLGVSTERQQEADERIPLLLQTPAAVRFISAEPLLGPIDLTHIWHRDEKQFAWLSTPAATLNSLRGVYPGLERPVLYDDERGPHLDWVIAGGESGPHARPMHPDWARSLRDQCKAAGVAFFFKQWGAFEPEQVVPIAVGARDIPEGTIVGESDSVLRDIAYAGHGRTVTLMRNVGKKAAGRLLDGELHNAMPEARRT